MGSSVSCKGLCGQISRDYTMACSCDSKCPIYGDCCLDFESKCPEIRQVTPKYHMINSGVCIEKFDEFKKRTLLIGQCRKGWTNEKIERKCHMTDETIYGFVPVTDNVTMMSYRNMYCAICNGVLERKLIFWQINITCDDSFVPSSAEDFFEGFEKHGCVNQLFPPEEVEPTLRQCEIDRDGCSENNCSNNEVKQLCEGGFTMRLSYKPSKVIFKNPFCALCHGYAENFVTKQYTCGRQPFSVGRDLGAYSFSLLMDFSDSGCTKLKLDGKDGFSEECDMNDMINGSAGICDEADTLCQEAFRKSSSNSDWMGLVSIICLSLSIVCMVCRIIAHPLVKVYHNLPNEMQLSLIFAMLLTAICFLTGPTQVNRRYICSGIGVAMHWMLLASFLWMNAIAYDMFKVFSSIVSHSKHQRVKFLALYSCYSWILSAIIVLISLSLDLTDIESSFRPYYGVGVCWIAQRNSLIIFVGVPIAAIIIINAIFYVRTYIYLHSALHSAKLKKSRSGGAQHSFGIYIRLFVLMGMTWVLGYIAAFTKHDVMWTLFIIFNATQGVFISLPSLLSKQVRRHVAVKIGLRDAAYSETSTSQVSVSKMKKESMVKVEMVKSDRNGEACDKSFSDIDKETQVNNRPDPNFI